MDCLFIEQILDRVIGFLDLKHKFIARRVCRLWRDRADTILSQHKRLVITRRGSLSYVHECHYHPIHESTSSTIKFSYQDLWFWQRIMDLMPHLKVVFIDVSSSEDDESDGSKKFLLSLVKLVVSRQHTTLECLWMPDFDHWFQEDYNFPDTDSMPRLVHIAFYNTTEENMRNLLDMSPRLESLRCASAPIDWTKIPVGFKRLESADGSFKGLDKLLSSRAVESIEMINYIRVIPEIYRGPYYFKNLKEIRVSIKDGANDCLLHLGRIIRFSPVEKVDLFILTEEELTVENWNAIFIESRNVVDFTVYCPPKMSHVDGFVEGIVSNMKNLKILSLGFAVSSHGLNLLTQLQNLQVFKQLIFDPEGMFDEITLVSFLETCFRNSMQEYEIIVRHTIYGSYIEILRENIDRLHEFASQLNIQIDVGFEPPDRTKVTDIHMVKRRLT